MGQILKQKQIQQFIRANRNIAMNHTNCPIDVDRYGGQYCNSQQSQGGQVLIEEQVHIAPNFYLCNKKPRKEIQFQRRIINHLKEFSQKYNIHRTGFFHQLKEKIISMRRQEPQTRGLRQCAAIVVYMALRNDLRVGLKEFCRNNNLNLKMCNRKYKVYHKLFEYGDSHFQDVEGINELSVGIKVEQFKQHNVYQLQQEEKNVLDVFEDEKGQAQICRIAEDQRDHWHRAINSIFDFIFRGFYYKTNKRIIITKLIERISKIDHQFLYSLGYSQQNPQMHYYIIYALLRCIKMKISFASFSRVVKQNINYTLSKKKADDIQNALMEAEMDRVNSQEQRAPLMKNMMKEEVCRQNEELIHMVQSPVILQEEFFSFDNYYYFPHDNDSYN